MTLLNVLSIFVGKAVLKISVMLNFGAGGTWPGELALMVSPDILPFFAAKIKKGIILIAGTNGKTTTSLMIKTILEQNNFSVIHNDSGANLLNGIVSAFIEASDFSGSLKKTDYAVFEVDENTLPKLLKNIAPKAVICLNLFRDQLDRYGEVDIIAEKWKKALMGLSRKSVVLLNSDDPQVAYLGKKLTAKTVYFGINAKSGSINQLEHATDSIFCLHCQHRLIYERIYYSHIGLWKCNHCGLKRPNPDYSQTPQILPGFYNKYNSLAAIAAARELKIPEDKIKNSLISFSPAFGRQEEMIKNGRKIKIFLSKNPTGFNESIKTVLALKAQNLLLVLNDRIPDGRDVSWIWDVDFERLGKKFNCIVSGDRIYDLALRLRYAGSVSEVIENLPEAIKSAISKSKSGETLYILATYSAMLEVRKILSGRKIL